MRRVAAALYGFLAYLAFLIPIGYLVGFLADWGVPKTIDRGAGLQAGSALAVDLALLVAFGLQHSVMARSGFKRAIERWVPKPMERSTYVLASGLALAALFWLWRPIPAVLWDVSGTALGALAGVGFATGWGLAVWATFALSHFHLFGVSQVAAYVRGQEHPRLALRRTLLYRIARHPMTAGLLLAFWSTPRMTQGHLVFAAGMALYSLVATVLEERELLREFGRGYRAYRREVPALVPVLRPGLVLPRWAGLGVELTLVALGLTWGAAVPLKGAGVDTSPADGRLPQVRSERLTIEHGGAQRSVSVYDPGQDAVAPRPLVLALHGTGGDARRLHALLGGVLEREAASRGWLVAYPEAVQGVWNDCRKAADSPARAAGVDDVAFLRAVVDRLTRERRADPERVYLLGYSGGGHMAYRVALEAGSWARGIAVFAASLPKDENLLCRDTGEPVPIMVVNGRRDLVNPVAGGDVIAPDGRFLGSVRSARATARYFEQRLGDAPIRLVLVDGGHAVPGPGSRFPSMVGHVVRTYPGIEAALDFFQDPRADGDSGRSRGTSRRTGNG